MTFQEQAKDAIRASGGRMTSQRQVLLDLLVAVRDGITAEDLFRLAVDRDPNMSLPTVYRTLHTLEAAHVVSSHYLSSEHERKLYRISDGQETTFHFTCRGCGQVIPFHSEVIDHLKRELSARLGAEVMTLCMCAGGLCAACREQQP
jgi:Fe2+ or Zn2+ uptake regulation protein